MIDTNMIAFDGIGALNVTFASDLTSEDEGKPVKVSANKTVALAGANIFHGKAIKVEKDGAVNVQIKGYVEFEYTGTAPTVGHSKLKSDVNNKVVVDGTNGHEYFVAAVDTTTKTVGLFL
ncbi:hypothetical protein [Crassaminicella profunda]|uniref:hypothetical protein n=1 Tax=Crassaminicella profunda TaxID=1286698 RepID=UPI001CA70EA8|nr:hypothetical protein [Crassaminicella profunda]QZY56702.1 hypothetical protein K7H06_07215 [Crassaminicella profunda]